MMKKFIILFAMIGVCSFIAANLYSNLLTTNTANAEAQTEAEGDTVEASTADSAPDLEALKKAAAENPTKPTVPEGAVDMAALIYGDENAPIIIEEFASFTCSHCAHFHRDVLPQLKTTLLNNGLAQLRIYSFVRNAQDLEATMIVQCQETKDAQKKFASAIMRGQEQWAFSTNYQDGLRTIARVGGMSEEDYDKCVADKALVDKVASSRQWFDKQVKVDATPYFRIGDEIIKGARGVDAFEKAIRTSLQK